MAYLNLAFVAVALLALATSGESIRCWSCSSDMDTPCADYFNQTSFNRFQFRYESQGTSTPQLMDCERESRNTFAMQQKAVCMKKKQTTYGRTTYIRQCRFIHPDEKVGTCPTETTGSATTIDFCEYCDFDGCNGATSLQRNFLITAILPVTVYFILRK